MNENQIRLVQELTDTWRTDSANQHQDMLDAVRATAQEMVPYNLTGYLDEFSKALAGEIRTLLGEVGRLHEQKRSIQLYGLVDCNGVLIFTLTFLVKSHRSCICIASTVQVDNSSLTGMFPLFAEDSLILTPFSGTHLLKAHWQVVFPVPESPFQAYLRQVAWAWAWDHHLLVRVLMNPLHLRDQHGDRFNSAFRVAVALARLTRRRCLNRLWRLQSLSLILRAGIVGNVSSSSCLSTRN